ncbi:hypothetical protein B5E73_09215 [Ligilactobacillus salivarius]|uniref:rolling circle replication-associated protein n=1 Tax=Ligilactobacillus salivarius TaxID=1624 RepID=UPI000B39ED86|nr:hypothetical protein [Ligilactobacillus salivarius]OUQ29889.1 hypothetical protein B5E73_09215 [Ligilactobacillus salivarius]
MTEISYNKQYDSYMDRERDSDLQNSSIKLDRESETLLLYKSRSGQASKNRDKRIWISKTRYYLTSELSQKQLNTIRDYKRKLSYYKHAKSKGIDIKRPTEPRFSNVKPHVVERKTEIYKNAKAWDKLAKQYEDIVLNTFNCSGRWVLGQYFITLTVADGRLKGQKVANSHYHAFVKQLQRWIGGKRDKGGQKLKYSMLTVKEYGKQGYHFHVLLKLGLPYTQVHEFVKREWKEKHGYIKVEALKDALGLSRYFFGGSNSRVALETDTEAIKARIQEREQAKDDFDRLAQIANKKGLKEMEKSYKDSSDTVEKELKELRRSITKSDDKILRTSGNINRSIRVTTHDKNFWNTLKTNATYLYSERITISEKTQDGKSVIINEVFRDYYRISKKVSRMLYYKALSLVKSGRAKLK